jgi:hypothetical protein
MLKAEILKGEKRGAWSREQGAEMLNTRAIALRVRGKSNV